jgi:hypothetical protein
MNGEETKTVLRHVSRWGQGVVQICWEILIIELLWGLVTWHWMLVCCGATGLLICHCLSSLVVYNFAMYCSLRNVGGVRRICLCPLVSPYGTLRTQPSFESKCSLAASINNNPVPLISFTGRSCWDALEKEKYCNVHAVGNMAVVYNSCYCGQATVNSRVWRKQNGGRGVNSMADARAVNIKWPQQWIGYAI